MPVEKDEILPEYDFSDAIVVSEPDVAAVFPNAGEVNEALRALAAIIHKHRSRRAGPRRSA